MFDGCTYYNLPDNECQHTCTCWIMNVCRKGQKSGPLCRTMPVPAGVTNSSFFTDFTIDDAILPVVSSIDFSNMEIIIKIPKTNTYFDVVVKSCSYL